MADLTTTQITANNDYFKKVGAGRRIGVAGDYAAGTGTVQLGWSDDGVTAHSFGAAYDATADFYLEFISPAPYMVLTVSSAASLQLDARVGVLRAPRG